MPAHPDSAVPSRHRGDTDDGRPAGPVTRCPECSAPVAAVTVDFDRATLAPCGHAIDTAIAL